MRAVWVIAKNTFREIIRDRILYGICVFALFLLGISLALGQLSFAEQARISADFGFTGIQIGVCVLAVFVGSTLVAREIEKQTILTLLARPISRTQFLMGKFAGLSLVILTIMVGLGLVLLGVVAFLNLSIKWNFLVALFGVFLEADILLAFALLFGTFSRPIMTVIFTVSLFLIGHWVNSLYFFIEKSTSSSFKMIGTVITKIVPNLEMFNWRSAPIYDSVIPLTQILHSLAYAVGWIVFLSVLTSLIFRRRDFV